MGLNEAKYRSAEQHLWSSFDLEPTERRVRLENLDVSIRIREVGHGPPIVLVHGASVDGTSWVQLLPGLLDFRCIVVDRPGCGLSDPLPGEAGRADVSAVKVAADQLVPDLLDALELPTAHVIGNSFGGFFALRAAAAAPERVDRVVLYSYSIGIAMDKTPLVMRFASIPGLGETTAHLPMTTAGAKMMLRQVGLKAAIDSGKFNDDMLSWFVALLRHTPTLINEIRSTPKVITPLRGLNHEILFTDELLAKITSEVFCFWGTDDPNGGAETARQFVARLARGQLQLVPNAGHAPWIDEIDQAIESTCAFLNG